jgi:hypothetical protein
MSNPDPNLVLNAGFDIWSALINNTGFTPKKTNHIFKRTIYVTRNIYVTLIRRSHCLTDATVEASLAARQEFRVYYRGAAFKSAHRVSHVSRTGLKLWGCHKAPGPLMGILDDSPTFPYRLDRDSTSRLAQTSCI